MRKSSTIWSSDFASRDTWLFDIRSTPSCCTSFSTRRVETPARYASAITDTNACSARRRGCSSQSGKYEPSLSFGTASSIEPTRVSQSRSR